MAKRLTAILACLVVLFLAIGLFDGTAWVGHTDLKIIFVVLDAETERPVSSAAIHVKSEGSGFCASDEAPSRYSLEANSSGRVIRTWSDCMCFGTKSFWQDTFGIHLPWLRFRASAPGYITSEWVRLNQRPYHTAVKRGDEAASLQITIPLQRKTSASRFSGSPPGTTAPNQSKATRDESGHWPWARTMKKSRIMWIENKGDDSLVGPARIGRVNFSKTGKSLYYGGRHFQPIRGFKSNYVDAETGETFWISGCRKDGRDALYTTDVEIDKDVREEYWTEIRNQPENAQVASFTAIGKCR